jgi:MerR family transcriptional regulator, copper efflux regulator
LPPATDLSTDHPDEAALDATARDAAARHGATLHQIGAVAERVGLSLRTIRHYDELGLVPPSGRTTGGFRLYTEDDIDRLRLLKHMQPLGFTLEEMRDLFAVRDHLRDDPDHDERHGLLERLAMYAAAAETRCEELHQQLAAAESMARVLRREASPQPRPTASRQ